MERRRGDRSENFGEMELVRLCNWLNIKSKEEKEVKSIYGISVLVNGVIYRG